MPFSAIPLPDLPATETLAGRLSALVEAGDMIALEGPLGAGKTTFVRALLEVLGIEDEVPSPTFTLVQNYDTPRFPIYHFDLYRLKDESELDELGWDDVSDSLTLVEWPELAGSRMPLNYLILRFGVDENGRRQCIPEPHGNWTNRWKDGP